MYLRDKVPVFLPEYRMVSFSETTFLTSHITHKLGAPLQAAPVGTKQSTECTIRQQLPNLATITSNNTYMIIIGPAYSNC